MVKVVFGRVSNKLVEFKAEGHAESVEEGYDLVCSGISASSIMIANGITDVLKIPAAISQEDGFLHINLRRLSPGEIEKCQVLMETILLGLKSMEYNYGKYIKVMVEEV
jgi:uncharacterized protein YsxB (DUF464 family)